MIPAGRLVGGFLINQMLNSLLLSHIEESFERIESACIRILIRINDESMKIHDFLSWINLQSLKNLEFILLFNVLLKLKSN